MRYIERILQPGETLVYSGKIHWVIYLPAMILVALALAALTQVKTGSIGMSWLFASIAFWLAAGVTFASAWFKRWTTEIDVTNRRVVYKRGFIKRHTVEMNMDKVESVDVDQSVFGRLLNYGDITIHGTGEGWETLHGIGAPLDFRNHVTAR
jgi:Bacterial membrane flanked domain.